ncbi:hypothetical protein ABIB82_000277 [Bradyrhizobium sp. i1.8.4]
MTIFKSRDGVKFGCRTSKRAGPVFLTPSAQKLTKLLGSPLSTVRWNSPIGAAQS